MSPAAAPGSKAACLDKKVAYGLWEWGALWGDCGFEGTVGSAASK
jgi:hypothetical protein